MTDQPNRPEKKIEGGKKSNRAIIIINIIAVLVIGGMAAYYFFIFDKKNDIKSRGDFVGKNISSDDFCEQWKEKGDLRDKKLPTGKELPEGIDDYNSKIEEICEDGKMTEAEQQELSDLKGSFKK